MADRPGVRYIRYADDIRIWAHDEESVRYAAAMLDRLCRNIGIHPHTTKFGIQKVNDVEEILKTVSMPHDVPGADDEAFEGLEDDQKKWPTVRLLWELLRVFVETGELEDVTRFKFLLGSVTASNKIAVRLCTLIRKRPDLTEPCCYYIDRCTKPSKELVGHLIGLVDAFPGYAWMSGRLLRTLFGHLVFLDLKQREQLTVVVNGAMDRRGIRADCQLQGITRVLSVALRCTSQDDLARWTIDPRTHWWAVTYFIREADADLYGRAYFVQLLVQLLGQSNREICRAAALRLCVLNVRMPRNAMDPDGECRAIFLKHGLSRRVRHKGSRINTLLRELIPGVHARTSRFQAVNWITILGSDHDDILKYVVRLLSEHRTSRDEFIMGLDAAMETVFDSLWKMNGFPDVDNSGKKLDGNRGKRLRRQTAFSSRYPATRHFCIAINDLRNRCELSHRRNTFSQARNSSVSYDDIEGALRLMQRCLSELAGLPPEC
jgi:hypothetical protein